MSHPLGHAAAPPARRGSVMFITLATLAVVGLIAMAMVRGTIIGRRTLRAEHAVRQVEAILDAAEARVRSRLAAGTPAAETIDLAAAEVAGTHGAQVVVTVDPHGTDDWKVRIVVAAPPDGPAAIRRTRDTLIRARPSTSQETSP